MKTMGLVVGSENQPSHVVVVAAAVSAAVLEA